MELHIGTETHIQAATALAMTQPSLLQPNFRSSLSCLSVLLVNNSNNTKITIIGFLALCQLNLTELNIGQCTINLGSNGYGDYGALLLARHIPKLETLWLRSSGLGAEGVGAIADNLTKLETFMVSLNEEVMQGIGLLGRLPSLRKLDACIYELTRRQHRAEGLDYGRTHSSVKWNFVAPCQ